MSGYCKGLEIKDVKGSTVAEVSIKWRAGWGDNAETYYPRVSFWGRDAQRVAESIGEDDKIMIQGFVTGSRIYKKRDGSPGVGFDIKGAGFAVLEKSTGSSDQPSNGNGWNAQNNQGGGGWGGQGNTAGGGWSGGGSPTGGGGWHG